MIKVSTAKGNELFERTKNNYGTELSQIYSAFSEAKKKAMRYCKDKYATDDNGRNFRIISYNNFCFSVAWDTMYELDNLTVPGVHIETAMNSYDVIMI